MKKLLLIIPIALYLFMVTYSTSDGKAQNALNDLTGLKQLETASSYEKLNSSGMELLSVLEEQEKLIRAMDEHIYYGSLNFSDIDTGKVQGLIDYSPGYNENAALFKSKTYKAYFEIRSRKLIADYQKKGVLDTGSALSDGRAVFDSFMAGQEKSPSGGKELTLLLQQKLMDRLVYDNIPDKGKYFFEVLSLRKNDKQNTQKRQDYLYELFESRARLELLKYVVDSNKHAIYDKTKAIGIKLYSHNEYKVSLVDAKGSLDAQKPDTSIKAVELFKDKEGCWSVIPLQDLIDFNTSKGVKISAVGGAIVPVTARTAASKVEIDSRFQLSLDLDLLASEKTEEVPPPGSSQKVDVLADGGKEQERLLATQCSAKYPAGGLIVRTLSKYSMYIDSKIGNKSSLYTKEFEKNKKAWQSELRQGLGMFDPAGKNSAEKLCSMIIFNKRLGDFYAGGNFKEPASIKAVLKYREQVMQFRSFEDGERWLLDMAYELWSNGEMQ